MNVRNKLRSREFRRILPAGRARPEGGKERRRDIISIREHQLEGTGISPLSRCMLEVTSLKLRPFVEASSEFKDVRINAAVAATSCASCGSVRSELRKK